MEKSLKAPIRVLIISSRTLVRSGLSALLRGQPQIQVVEEVASPFDSVGREFDVALWDVGNADPRAPPFRFLALLSKTSDTRAWFAAGAAGIVLETALVEELLSAIRQVARGETFLPPSVAKQIVPTFAAHNAPREQEIEPLTDREREVLQLLVQGLSNKDIAQKLYLSVRTVEGHLANIYGKLRVKSRTEAALWAVQHL
jgi:DNA-binding NarL/FixJ family response regulator